MIDNISAIGSGEFIIEWKDGRKEFIPFRNRILRSGRIALVKALANDFGAAYQYFITGITFGSGGTSGGAPRYIDDTREGLFGPVIITKPVISSISPDIPTQVVFTSVLTFDEAVGETINEMALRFSSGDYYSMVTFGDITKSSSMQLVYNWTISIV